MRRCGGGDVSSPAAASPSNAPPHLRTSARGPAGDAWIAAALAAGVVATRLPFAGAILYHLDSINFAMALDRFDVHASRPHMPGYPLYVLLGRAVNRLVADPQLALVAISVLSSGLAVAALYGLGRTMFDRRTGLTSALLLAASPLFWFYGAIALPHALDALMVIVAVWSCYRIRLGAAHLAVPAAVWLGVAGGLRPQTQAFLAPLALWAGLALDWRRRLQALAVLAVVDLCWFVPLLVLSGGWTAYFAELNRFNSHFSRLTSVLAEGGWFGLFRNVWKLGIYTLYGLAGGLLLVPAAAARADHGWEALRRGDPRALTVLLWVVPVLAFYVFIHMGQQGLIFVFLPALLLALGCAVALLPAYRATAATVAAVGLGAGIFLAAPTFPLRTDRVKLLTAETLRGHDRMYATRFSAVRERFDPTGTAIVSTNGRFPQFYLPQFSLLGYGIGSRWERGEGEPNRREPAWIDPGAIGLRPAPNGRYRVVLLESALGPYNLTPQRAEQIRLPDDTLLTVLTLDGTERFYMGPDGFGVAPEGVVPRAPSQTMSP